MYSSSVENLIKLFSKFPTIGHRTAARFVFYLISLNNQEIEELIKAIEDIKKVKICPLCFNHFEGEKELCEICTNPSRDKSLICVIEKETDLESIEKIKKYRGFYFVLGGTVSMLKKDDINKLRIKELEQRIKNHPEIQEIILALNPTTEGEATSLYLERILKPLNKKITRLGRGLSTGGELEYADEQTLRDALDGRK
ncbi:recombination mediator RecR [Patescibacteria group bacterium]|nr:recombination mediator RecR [Patescibacteria group bacterium]MBU1877006.1 recombination mediator RecR [Patescibacteria group bacterium]